MLTRRNMAPGFTVARATQLLLQARLGCTLINSHSPPHPTLFLFLTLSPIVSSPQDIVCRTEWSYLNPYPTLSPSPIYEATIMVSIQVIISSSKARHLAGPQQLPLAQARSSASPRPSQVTRPWSRPLHQPQ